MTLRADAPIFSPGDSSAINLPAQGIFYFGRVEGWLLGVPVGATGLDVLILIFHFHLLFLDHFWLFFGVTGGSENFFGVYLFVLTDNFHFVRFFCFLIFLVGGWIDIINCFGVYSYS